MTRLLSPNAAVAPLLADASARPARPALLPALPPKEAAQGEALRSGGSGRWRSMGYPKAAEDAAPIMPQCTVLARAGDGVRAVDGAEPKVAGACKGATDEAASGARLRQLGEVDDPMATND